MPAIPVPDDGNHPGERYGQNFNPNAFVVNSASGFIVPHEQQTTSR